jgi:hypothetical protein
MSIFIIEDIHLLKTLLKTYLLLNVSNFLNLLLTVSNVFNNQFI